MSAADTAWGYGVLENETALAWEGRFAGLIDPERPRGDGSSRALPRDAADTEAEAQSREPGLIERIAGDEQMRRDLAPRIAASAEALATAAGEDEVAWQVLGVLFLAAGITLPTATKMRVLDALGREVAYDCAEEEFSGWSHWSMRTGILRAVRGLVERGDADPVYAGGEAMWALSDAIDLDGFLLTPMHPASTGLPRHVNARMCTYGEVEERSPTPKPTLAVAMSERPPIYDSFALVTVEEPVRQVHGPEIPPGDLDCVARWIALNREALLAHWYGRTDSLTFCEACKRLP